MRPHSEDNGSLVERPVPVPRPSDRVREWIDWFGLARLVTSAVAVVVVCVGTWSLVRTPTPPPESSLPIAVGGSSLPTVTLPPPVAPETAAGSIGAVVDAGPDVVVVHVAGAVASPGVYRLDPGDRVADAIGAAGGATGEADQGAVNLAAPLVDGSRIHLPEFGEEVTWQVTPATTPADGGEAAVGPIDVNVADASALERLPGVGPATAAAIVAERERNGPFVSFDDLERVPGIGPAKLAALDGLVVT